MLAIDSEHARVALNVGSLACIRVPYDGAVERGSRRELTRMLAIRVRAERAVRPRVVVWVSRQNLSIWISGSPDELAYWTSSSLLAERVADTACDLLQIQLWETQLTER